LHPPEITIVLWEVRTRSRNCVLEEQIPVLFTSNVMPNSFEFVKLVLPDIIGGQPKIVYYLQEEVKEVRL